MLIRARKVLRSPLWKPQPPWLIFAWWLGPPLAVLLAVLWLWEHAGPADALAGRGTEKALARGTPPGPQRPSGSAKCAPRGATKSALGGLFSS